MTAAVGAPEPRSIRAVVRAAEERSRISFRLKFVATWVVLIGLIVGGLWFTEQHRHRLHRRVGTIHRRRCGPHDPDLAGVHRVRHGPGARRCLRATVSQPVHQRIGVALRVPGPRHASRRADPVRLSRTAAGRDRAAGDPRRDHRAQLQLWRLHDRDLPSRASRRSRAASARPPRRWACRSDW